MVGMVRTIVKDVKIFMTLFKLFETIAEKVLLMLSTNFSCILVVFSPCSSSIRISLKMANVFWMIKISALYKRFNTFKLSVKAASK